MDLAGFERARVAVLGDLVADVWIHARPARLSREAPVLVLRHEREELGLGGAANVARNLRALGAGVSLFGAVGRDAHGRELLRGLEAEGIDLAGCASVPGWSTPVKTRVLAAGARRHPQQVLRIDRDPAGPLPDQARAAAASALAARLAEFDALLFSDYEYGAIGAEAATVAAQARQAGRACVLDPRRSPDPFARALTAITPNVGELAQYTRRAPDELERPEALCAAAAELLAALAPRSLLVTRGNLGMALFGDGAPPEGLWLPASGAGEVSDVCGAGDTAAAAFTLALASGASAADAMRVANAAAGVVVLEQGTAVCTRAQLERALGAIPVEGGPRPAARARGAS